jgi:uncharacterized protein YoxC
MNCGTENRENCKMKLVCKFFCTLVTLGSLILLFLLYTEVKKVSSELNEMNESMDYTAEYLDDMKSNIRDLNINTSTIANDVSEIKNRKPAEAK